MVETFLCIVTVLLAIVGLSELVHWLSYMILKPKVKPHKQLIVYLNDQDAEQQLLSIIEELRWQGKRYADSLVAVTGDLSDEKKIICRSRFCGKGIFFTDTVSVNNDCSLSKR